MMPPAGSSLVAQFTFSLSLIAPDSTEDASTGECVVDATATDTGWKINAADLFDGAPLLRASGAVDALLTALRTVP